MIIVRNLAIWLPVFFFFFFFFTQKACFAHYAIAYLFALLFIFLIDVLSVCWILSLSFIFNGWKLTGSEIRMS